MKNTDLTLDDVKQIINQKLTLGSSSRAGGNSKLISYQPSTGLYHVYADKKLIGADVFAQDMLDLYNSISV